jgi:hypothetical protein
MAKAAHVADYDINANWKLVYENNRCAFSVGNVIYKT